MCVAIFMPMGSMSPLEFDRAITVAKREARADMAKVSAHSMPFAVTHSSSLGVGFSVHTYVRTYITCTLNVSIRMCMVCMYSTYVRSFTTSSWE